MGGLVDFLPSFSVFRTLFHGQYVINVHVLQPEGGNIAPVSCLATNATEVSETQTHLVEFSVDRRYRDVFLLFTLNPLSIVGA